MLLLKGVKLPLYLKEPNSSVDRMFVIDRKRTEDDLEETIEMAGKSMVLLASASLVR